MVGINMEEVVVSIIKKKYHAGVMARVVQLMEKHGCVEKTFELSHVIKCHICSGEIADLGRLQRDCVASATAADKKIKLGMR